MQQQIQKLGKFIETSSKILLINHIRMDGDAWGSLGGLALVLKSMGKQVEAINDEEVPEFLNFLGHNDIIKPDLDVLHFNPDIIISLDAAGSDRLGESYIQWKAVFDKKPFIVIDHHISNSGFGDVNIIDIKASSVCELLTHMLYDLKLEKHISCEAATFFYTGIQTDTNMYATSNTTPATLEAGAKLIELGANFRLPIEKCFRQKTPEQIQAQKLAYNNLKISPDGNISYSCISQDEIEKSALDIKKFSEYLKGFINETLINIEGVKVSFLLYPLVNGEIKGSLRSQDGYDVNAIAGIFGGGGHTQAAGFQSNETQQKIMNKLLGEIQNTLD